MRKASIWVYIFFLAVAGAGVAQAQGKLKTISSATKLMTRTPSVPVSKALPDKIPSAVAAFSAAASSLPSNSAALSEASAWETIRQLQQENARLRQANIELKASALSNTIPSDAYIFQAREKNSLKTPSNIFSGSIFSVEYNGKTEVYGVIATHAIASDTTEKYALHKTFTAAIYKNGLQRLIPVEVVAASPKSMLDIALVKFPKKSEALLVPYRLGKLNNDTNLISKGFSSHVPMAIAQRKVVSCTPTSIRTTIPLERTARPGLCGSAVLNEHNELVGIHTGSIYSQEGEQSDIAYATPSYYLPQLVEAYHNDGKATIPFMVNGFKIADFAIEEYISYISLIDAEKRTLWQMQVPAKFSYSKLQEGLNQHPDAAFLQITTRQASWTDDGYAFVENRTKSDRSPKTTYTYDLQENKLVSALQSVYDQTTRKRKTISLLTEE